MTKVAFGVLGPVEAGADGEPVPLRGARQRAVLARLLVARGRVVPTDLLVDDLWEVPPDGAVGAIRTFVADLRRALEPDRPPREPARVLVTVAPGYALRAAPDAVDAWRFELLVSDAANASPATALALLTEALGLWRGPAYAEWSAQPWARAEIDRLEDRRLFAVERRAEAMLSLGRAAEAASDLNAHVEGHPLREDAWRLLATALYRAGRQADALAALRRARGILADQLGIDPGPDLRRLEADILAQSPSLDPRPVIPQEPWLRTASARDPRSRDPKDRGPAPFVGRDEELALLERAVHPHTALALVSGEAGAGKTALAEELARRLAAGGWASAWGRAPEHEGAPFRWPWTLPWSAAVQEVVDAQAVDVESGLELDRAVAAHRQRRAAISRLAALASQGPLVLVVDDAQRADEGTLDVLGALLSEPLDGPLLIVVTYRATEISPALTAALAAFATVEPVRVYLGALRSEETATLAGAVAGRQLDPEAARLVHRRSGGNPFFVRELARLLAAEGPDAVARVPAGVRDVIRHRLSLLPEPARTVLRQAAVVGRDIDVEVLAAVVKDENVLLDALDRAVQAGFLTEEPLRFTHILVRDTLYGDLTALRRTSWHAAAAVAIERLHPGEAAALAHHFGLAGRTHDDQAARYARVAAEQAERRSDPHEAARLWRVATHHSDERERLTALMALGRALAVTGHLAEARRLRAEATAAAERIDDPDLTVAVLVAFEVPAVWPRNDDEQLSAQIVRAAERALATLPTGRVTQRSRLLSTLALELRGSGDDRGRRAALEAERLARETDDPAVLAFALDARYMHTFYRAGLSAERAAIGAELVTLARAHELVTFEVLGHLILIQSHCAVGDVEAADAEIRAAEALADRYHLPHVVIFTDWYRALRLALEGRPAEDAYRAAAARLATAEMPGMADGLLGFALYSLSGRLSEPLGPYEPWVQPLLLLAAGDRAGAAAALAALPDPPRDLLLEARLVLAARAALALNTDPTPYHTALLPAADELAGAGSGALTLGPVVEVLARPYPGLTKPDS